MDKVVQMQQKKKEKKKSQPGWERQHRWGRNCLTVVILCFNHLFYVSVLLLYNAVLSRGCFSRKGNSNKMC